jgi:hypothetical protein
VSELCHVLQFPNAVAVGVCIMFDLNRLKCLGVDARSRICLAALGKIINPTVGGAWHARTLKMAFEVDTGQDLRTSRLKAKSPDASKAVASCRQGGKIWDVFVGSNDATCQASLSNEQGSITLWCCFSQNW